MGILQSNNSYTNAYDMIQIQNKYRKYDIAFHLSRFLNNPSSAWVKMKGKMKKTDILLYKYFQSWINVYKRGSIRKVRLYEIWANFRLNY